MNLELLQRNDQARRRMETARNSFYLANSRDQNQEKSKSETLKLYYPDGQKKNFIQHAVVCRRGTRRPAWVSRRWYWLCAVLGIAYCYRRRLLRSARKEMWWVTKLFT